MRSARRLLICVGFAATGAGCGIHDPYQTHQPATAPSTTSGSTMRVGAAPTRSARAAPTAPAGGAAAPTPQDALARYARLYCNWTAANVAALRAARGDLARTGPRASAPGRASTRATKHSRERRRQPGHLVAITPSEERGRWVVVTTRADERQAATTRAFRPTLTSSGPGHPHRRPAGS